MEDRRLKRTWYRKTSDGTFFRNCPLIMAELKKAPRWPRFRRFEALSREWDECFHRGIVTTRELGRRDRWIEFDDSREATDRWAAQFLAEHGYTQLARWRTDG